MWRQNVQNSQYILLLSELNLWSTFKILMEWLSILHTTAKWLNCLIESLYILKLHFCSTQFKSFPYLYNEDQFIAALAKDVKIVKTLPKDLKGARRKKEIPSFKVPHGASPYFYLHHVLPMLTKHSVVELLVHSGGCLQVTSITFISNKICPWILPFFLRS